MRRKDMKPGVLYAIGSNGMYRPGLIHDASNERIRARVYWSWPAPAGGDEQDYLDPNPSITDPTAKYDDKIVRTGEVIGEWGQWAVATRAERQARLQAKLDQEAQEAADEDAAIAERTARIQALAPLLQGVEGYLSIDTLMYRVKSGDWSRDYFSAKDVVTLIEHAVQQTKMGVTQ